MKGSHWDRTYGWGYINMDAAYWQREFVYEKTIGPKKPLCYLLHANRGDKITVVWERRFDSGGKPYDFTPLKMELFRAQDQTLIDVDDSQIDNVLQVANYPRNNTMAKNGASPSVIVKLSVAKGIDTIDGREEEPIAIAATSKLQQQLACP
jgi:serine protease AprX